MGTNLSCCSASPFTPTDTNPMDTNQTHPRSIDPTDTNPMGSNQSLPRPRPVSPTNTNPMDTKQRRLPNIQFRVLIIGRANAGKTTILQRVCDTTESPTIYRRNSDGEREHVRSGGLTILPARLMLHRIDLTRPWRLVS